MGDNIAQIDEASQLEKQISTHWKEMYDSTTGQMVLKKKMGYSTLKEANMAIDKWRIDHPEDAIPMAAYQCAHCGKFHIGHNRSLLHNVG